MSFTHDKRIIIYPNYINKLRTVAEGRRIPTAQACEDPNPLEMFDCCKYLKLPADIEDKHYSREWMVRGRLRVQLKNEDGTPVNPEVPTRRALLLKIAELVPKHPNRSKAKQAAAAQQAVAAAKQQEDASGSSSKAGGSSKGSSKKKGKK